MEKHQFEIQPRAAGIGGGYNLKLLEHGLEVGGGAYPICEELPTPEAAYAAAYEDGLNWVEASAKSFIW
jgi:hypothetical protein